METILWYDLETFGTYTLYDRIAQIAWIRTDLEYNFISQNVLYCKIPDYYLPHPEACFTNHLTPQVVNKKGLTELEFAEKIRKEFTQPDTIVIGFNNLEFDDKFIRALFYRTLFHPYSHENNITRWDIMNLAKATHDLRPNGIKWPHLHEEKGYPVFKLVELTKANSIDQEGAHDALVDVRATIEIAKLIKSKQPRLFNYYFCNRIKSNLNKVIKNSNVILVTQFFHNEFWRICTHPLLILNSNEVEELKNKEEKDINFPRYLYCYDLLLGNPESIEEAKDKGGLIKIDLKSYPFVAPISVLTDETTENLGYSKEQVMKTVENVLNTRVLTDIDNVVRLTDYYNNNMVAENPAPEVFKYKKYNELFYSKLSSWKGSLKQNDFSRQIFDSYDDYQELSLLFMYNNYPNYLSNEDKKQMMIRKKELLNGNGLNKDKVMTTTSYIEHLDNPEVQGKFNADEYTINELLSYYNDVLNSISNVEI